MASTIGMTPLPAAVANANSPPTYRMDPVFGIPVAGPRSPPPATTRTPTGRESTTAPASAPAGGDLPPMYGTPDCPAPAYEVVHEPSTLAQHLFKYGFYFPVFWIIGAAILFLPLKPEPEIECGKSPEEQKEEIIILRKAELKWAKRCAYAVVALLGVIALIILALWGAKAGVFEKKDHSASGQKMGFVKATP